MDINVRKVHFEGIASKYRKDRKYNCPAELEWHGGNHSKLNQSTKKSYTNFVENKAIKQKQYKASKNNKGNLSPVHGSEAWGHLLWLGFSARNEGIMREKKKGKGGIFWECGENEGDCGKYWCKKIEGKWEGMKGNKRIMRENWGENVEE